MSYLGASPPESWELEEEKFLSSILSQLSDRRRMAILLTSAWLPPSKSPTVSPSTYSFRTCRATWGQAPMKSAGS